MADIDTDGMRCKLKTERFALSAAVQAAARNELIRELPPLLNHIDRLQAENQRLREAVNEVSDLIQESYGVAGLHQNGDVAEWSELLPGGNFEGWLEIFGEVAALTKEAGE